MTSPISRHFMETNKHIKNHKKQTNRSREERIPCDWVVQLLAVAKAVLPVENQPKLAEIAQELAMMLPEPLQHPYELLVKAELK